MPYTVTLTHLPEHDGATGYVVSRVAFGSLEGAREAAKAIVLGVNAPGTGLRSDANARLHPDARQVVWLDVKHAIESWRESGGTITLPDGITVTVEPESLIGIGAMAGLTPGQMCDMPDAEIYATFNAKFAAGSPSTTTED